MEYNDTDKPGAIKLKFTDILEADNIAELLTEDQRKAVGQQVVDWYEKDKLSREGWEKKNQDSLKLAMQVVEHKTYPWPGAANVKFPLLTIASLQFSARVYPALIKAPDLVKYRVMGRDPQGLKASRAYRVGKYMSYQLLDEDEQWEEDQDKLFIALPIVGCMFKKTFYDPMAERPRSRLVFPEHLVVHYYAKDLQRSRATELFELYPSEIKERQLRGLYVKYEDALKPGNIADKQQNLNLDKRQGIEPPQEDAQTPRDILESHCFWDFDGDGLEEPYVVTVDKTTKYALRIKTRFQEVISEESIEADRLRKEAFLLLQSVPPPEQVNAMMEAGQLTPEQQTAIMNKIRQVESQVQQIKANIQVLEEMPPNVIRIVPRVHYTKYSFIPAPDGGFYDLGFGQLLAPINDSVNTLLNQLIDSGTLQNGSQGFIGKGARIEGGRVRFEPYEWKRVNVAGATLKDSLVPLPVNEPSAVLFQLLSLLIQYAERISSVTEIMQGENPGQNTPAYNMSAMLEQGLQVFNGVFKRIYRSFRSEIRKLYLLNAEYLDPENYFETMDGAFNVLQSDFGGDPRDLVPAADPNAFSNMEKLMKSQYIAQRAMTVPGYNPVMVEKRLLEDMDIPDVDEIYPLNPDGSWAIPPAPNPETEIEKADMQRRTLEGKVRGEIEAAKAEADIKLKEAQAVQIYAEIEATGNQEALEKMKLIQEQMKMQREEAKGKIDLLLKQMDLWLKEKDLELAEKQIEVEEAKGESAKQVAQSKSNIAKKKESEASKKK